MAAAYSSSGDRAESPPPLYERLLNDANKLFEQLSQRANSGAASAKADDMPPPGDGQGESTGGSLVVRQPTFWERNFNPDSPFFERLRGNRHYLLLHKILEFLFPNSER